MNVFELFASISLDTSGFEHNLNSAKNSFNAFSKSLSGAGDFTKTLVKGFEGVESVGKRAGEILEGLVKGFAAISTAVAGFAASAAKTGMEFDASISQVGATMGYTVEELNDKSSDAYKTLQQLRGAALDFGASTSFSATEAANALNYMALAGYDAETSMKMLPNVLNLAAAGSIDLASASDMITDAQSALGLTLEQTNEMVDQMARAASKSNTSVAQLGDAILTVGGTASYMAGGTEEINTVLGVLADNGIKGAEAGTHLRNMLLSLSAPTTKAQKQLKELKVEVFDAEGNMRSFSEIFPELNAAMADLTDQQKLDAFSTLFNSRDIASATALLNTTTERWEELGGAIMNAKGAAEEMAAVQLDNLQGDVTLLKSEFEGLQITISDGITSMLRNFAQFGATAMNELRKGFESGGVSGFADALQGIVTDGASMLAEGAPEFADAVLQITEAVASGLLEAGPQILESMNEVFSGLIGGVGSWLSENGAVLAEVGMGVVDAIFSAFSSAGDVIASNIGTFIPLIVNAFLSYHETLFTVGIDILGAIGEGIVNSKDALQEMASSTITSIVTALGENAPMIIEGGIALIEALVTSLLENAGLIAESAVELVVQLATGIGEALPELLPAAVEAVLKFIEGLTSPESISNLLDGAISLIEGLIEGIANALPLLIEYAPTIIVNLVTGLIEGIPKLVDIGWKLLEGVLSGLIQAIAAIPAAIGKVVGAIIDGFLSLFGIDGDSSSIFADMGMSLIQGLLDGISAVWGWIVDFFVSSGEILINLLGGIWDAILSAATVAWELVSGVVVAAWNAIVAAWDFALEFFGAIWSGISQIFSVAAEVLGGFFSSAWSIITNIWSVAVDFFGNIWSGIESIFSVVADVLGGFFSAAWSAITSIWDSAVGFFSDLWSGIVSVFSNVWDVFVDIGGNIVKGLWHGIQSLASWLWDLVTGWISGIWNGILSFFGIASPSRQMAWVGEMLVSGLANAIDKDGIMAVRAMEDMGKDILDAADFSAIPVSFSPVSAAGIYNTAEMDRNAAQSEFGGAGNVTNINIYNPVREDSLTQSRNWRKEAQRMAMGYV